ncbi:MAG: DUF3987 domain-containing protein [Chitinophagaceae bacterium]
MISVADRLKNKNQFPFEVFPKGIGDSMLGLSEQTNIPADYLGVCALHAVAALSGNIYIGKINGGVKPIIYAMLIGPSGVGKSPAYKYICGSIIDSLRSSLADKYKADYAAWKERKKSAKDAKQEFNEPPPQKVIRMIEDGTEEAISKHAESSPAGFGVYYDEGGRMFGSASQYKRDNSSVNFWNELFNGNSYEIVRVDSEKDRFIENPAISVLIGMQKERLSKYFTEDVLHSGLAYRFLMCQAEFKPINELVDYFDNKKKTLCDEWQDIIKSLFNKGLRIIKDKEPILVEFTQDAKMKYNDVMGEIANAQNILIKGLKREDDNISLVAAGAKLQAYVARLALVLSIIDDHTGPAITVKNVEDASTLYKYFKRNSDKILLGLSSTAKTGLTEFETELLEKLPDNQFTAKQAEETSLALNLGRKFFQVSLHRKYKAGFIKIISKGLYEKC